MTLTRAEVERWVEGAPPMLMGGLDPAEAIAQIAASVLELVTERDRLADQLADAVKVANLAEAGEQKFKGLFYELMAYVDDAKSACGRFSYQGRPLPETCAEMLATIDGVE